MFVKSSFWIPWVNRSRLAMATSNGKRSHFTSSGPTLGDLIAAPQWQVAQDVNHGITIIPADLPTKLGDFVQANWVNLFRQMLVKIPYVEHLAGMWMLYDVVTDNLSNNRNMWQHSKL